MSSLHFIAFAAHEIHHGHRGWTTWFIDYDNSVQVWFAWLLHIGTIHRSLGQVTERLMVQHWKCCVRLVRTEGSNPSLSVSYACFSMIPALGL